MRTFLASLIFPLTLLAQPAGDWSISGVVLNSQTGEPVKYALVTLMSFGSPSEFRAPSKLRLPLRKTTRAGGAGEFQFNALAEAHYMISAQKPGFAVWFSTEQRGLGQIDLTASISGV